MGDISGYVLPVVLVAAGVVVVYIGFVRRASSPAQYGAIKFCPKCGLENPVSQELCERCGNPLKVPAGPASKSRRALARTVGLVGVIIGIQSAALPLLDGLPRYWFNDVMGIVGIVLIAVSFAIDPPWRKS